MNTAPSTWMSSGNAPMFTSFHDRLEILSRGKLPPRQTLEGFFAGESIPVNPALSRIFIQLHITEHTGRGVPKIIQAYSQENIRFNENSITVTIPYDRLGGDAPVTPQVTPQVMPQVLLQVAGQANTGETERKILDYCSQARSAQEILAYLGLKDRKNLMAHIRVLLEQGRIAQTIPDKPTSSKQKYITIK